MTFLVSKVILDGWGLLRALRLLYCLGVDSGARFLGMNYGVRRCLGCFWLVLASYLGVMLFVWLLCVLGIMMCY